MAADALAHCVPRSSATMQLTMQDKKAVVMHKVKVQFRGLELYKEIEGIN